jgi:hypothetical protein
MKKRITSLPGQDNIKNIEIYKIFPQAGLGRNKTTPRFAKPDNENFFAEPPGILV